ncbi:MAG: GtrA family protein [Thermomonas sp.]
MRRLGVLSSNDKLRFVLAGGSTTVFSYLLYALFLWGMDAKIAYSLSYVLGIAWSYSANTIWVFRRRWTWRGLLSFPLVYLIQAGLSFIIFVLLIDLWSLPELLAPLVTIVLMLPLTYVLSRAVIDRTSPSSASRSSTDTPP